MSHMETNRLSQKKWEYQDSFCKWTGEDLTSPCEDIPFCKTMTDEERAQHPHDAPPPHPHDAPREEGGGQFADAMGVHRVAPRRCVHVTHDLVRKIKDSFQDSPLSQSQMDTFSQLNSQLNTMSREAITAEHCAQIPYDSKGKWNPQLPGLEINSHGSCQVDTCRRRVKGMREMCIDPSRTPANFQTLFDEVATNDTMTNVGTSSGVPVSSEPKRHRPPS